MAGKRILVTGSEGFIGGSIAKALDKQNEVVMIDKRPGPRYGTGELHVGNLADPKFTDACAREIGSVDYIFHFGAPSSNMLYKDNSAECLEETVGGFDNVMRLAVKLGAQRVLYPSSATVYRPLANGQKSKETDKIDPPNLYGIAKATTEEIARYYRDTASIDSVGFRIFAGFGKGEEDKGYIASPVSLFMFDMLKGKAPVIWGDGSQKRDFVYIDDIVKAVITSMEKKALKHSIINVGSGKSVSFREIVALLNSKLVAEGLMKKVVQPTYVPKPVSYIEETCCDTELLEEELGFRPRALNAALDDYVSYIKVLSASGRSFA